jgi:hypothetical protein
MNGRQRRRPPLIIAALGGSLLVLAAAGCSMSFPFTRNNEYGHPLPEHAGIEVVVQRVNANIEHLQAWRSSDLRITGRSLPVHLTGNIAVEGPRNFRLTAGALGMTEEADFGSNPDWFWFWIRRSQAPFVFRARHDDMQHSEMLRQAIPFQPDWLIEALGVVRIDPKQVTRMEPGENHQTVNLISELLSPLGQPVQKVIRVDQHHGVVLGHYLYDANQKLIAKADLGNHQVDQQSGVIMPHLIALEWPQAGLQISLELGQIEINPGMIPPRIWEVPNKEPMYPSRDIGAATRMKNNPDQAAKTGRAPSGKDGPGIYGDASDVGFGNPSNKKIGKASPNSDNGTEWNKPLEASSTDADPGLTQTSARDSVPAQSEPSPNTARPRTATAASTDPFGPDDTWMK